MAIANEKDTVQNKILKYAGDIGREYLSPQEALRKRGGYDKIILKDIFIKQILELNPDFDFEQADEILKKIERLPTNIEGNLIAWEYLIGLKTQFVPFLNRELNIKFLDTENINNNVFHVTDELIFDNRNNKNRYDIVFYINGFPVLLVETKSVNKIDGMTEALKQIIRYHRQTPEALALMQIYALTHLIQFFYGATWNFSSKGLNKWKYQGKFDFEQLIKSFFDRKNIIELLTNYILFTKKDDKLEKVILRSHQIRAISKILQRAKDKKKNRGLIWHTQGSGKTYTMITAAKLILENPSFRNPTVLMLVDRNELEQQLFNNLESVGFTSIRIAKSKKDLQELLKQDYRGLIVTTIQKFHKMPANINKRSNIFVFIDEAHRTTEGDLGNYLMAALPKATIIGFTGTPRDKTSHGKGTFLTFGKDDPPHGYLDKYSILESIEDGTTLKINYAVAENKFLPKKEILEKEFLNLKELEGISDIQILNKAIQKAATLKNFLKNKDRIDKIAQWIAKHFKENVEPLGYKAFIVAVDREACVLYKNALDKYLPPDYSDVIISHNNNDPEELKKFHYSKEKEKEIRNKFKSRDSLPKILIVTEKLLTGYDAPVLYAMYLDKPMRDHVLLQAIARVNRPYEDENGNKKPAGLIIDFVGILKNLEKALAFDSSDIEGVLTDLEVLKNYFEDLILKGKEKYLFVTKKGDKAVEEILNYFIDEEKRKEFFNFYKELKTLYEIISPDPFLRPFIDDFKKLTEIYKILKQAYEDIDFSKKLFENQLGEKVKKILTEVETENFIKSELEIVEINEETLKKLLNKKVTDTEKIFNLLKSIKATINRRIQQEPYLISLAERVEKINEEYLKRQKTTKEIIHYLKNIGEELIKLENERKKLNMDIEPFTAYFILKSEGYKVLPYRQDLERIFANHKLRKENRNEEKALKTELTGLLIKIIGVSKIKEITVLVNKILDSLKKRGN